MRFNQYLTNINQSLPILNCLNGLYNVSLIDFDEKGVYNQSYIEKDFYCLKPSKREVVNFRKFVRFRKFIFKSYVIHKQLHPKNELK